MTVVYWILIIVGALLLITGGRVNFKQPAPANLLLIRVVGGVMLGAGIALLQG